MFKHEIKKNRIQQSRLRSHQRGVLLISVAATIVGTGIFLGTASQAKNIYQQVVYNSIYDELRNLEDISYAFFAAEKRWPGDCNRDGIIAYEPTNSITAQWQAEKDNQSCANSSKENLTSVFNDLHSAGLVNEDTMQDWLHYSSDIYFQYGHAHWEDESDVNANVLVAYQVPKDVALWLDNKVDGDLSGESGRLRRWDQHMQGSAWPDQQDVEMVSIAYILGKDVPR